MVHLRSEMEQNPLQTCKYVRRFHVVAFKYAILLYKEVT